MAKKKIVFQIKAPAAALNPRIDENPLYESAIEVEQNEHLNGEAERLLIEHAQYIRDVLNGKAKRDDAKYPGIIWKPDTAQTVNGTDYVNVEPDEWIQAGHDWTVEVLRKWAEAQKLKFEYTGPKNEADGSPGAYDSVHIFL